MLVRTKHQEFGKCKTYQKIPIYAPRENRDLTIDFRQIFHAQGSDASTCAEIFGNRNDISRRIYLNRSKNLQRSLVRRYIRIENNPKFNLYVIFDSRDCFKSYKKTELVVKKTSRKKLTNMCVFLTRETTISIQRKHCNTVPSNSLPTY